MGNRTTLLAIASAVALGFAGCGDDEDDKAATPAASTPAATTEAPPAEPTAFAVSITGSGKDIKMTAPKTTPAGLTEIQLTLEAKGDHGVQLVRIDGDHSLAEIAKAGDAWGDDGKPLADWITTAGGVPGKTGTTTSVLQVLEPGKYVAFDLETDAAAEFTVDGGDAAAELPETPATVTMKEYSFAAEGLTAGKQQVTVDNVGKEPHFIVAAPLAKGKTVADATKFFATEGEGASGPPPVDFEAGESTAVIEGGTKQVVDLDLKTGKYAFVCFIPDRAGGPPHIAKGMISEIEVP